MSTGRRDSNREQINYESPLHSPAPRRSDHASAKPIEFRSRPTKLRSRIYIYAALGRYTPAREDAMMADYGIEDVACDDLPRGVLIGTVELGTAPARRATITGTSAIPSGRRSC